jgi:hypothetical protein
LKFVSSLSNDTKSPSDDIGLVYAFAKAMDPESVVREGEYATVQKYSQSWAEKFGFNAKRVVQNSEFLTPEARMKMKATVAAKAKATQEMYKGFRKTITNRIDKFAGESVGEDLLGDVTAGGIGPEGEQPGTVVWEDGPDGVPRPKGAKK